MKREKRFLWADVIRVVAIFLVIQAHAPTPPPQITSPLSLPLMVWTNIVRTCVPLFIMLSGALLLEKKERYLLFFQKRLVKVLFPWLCWTIIYLVYLSIFHPEWIISPVPTFFFTTFLSYYWFLPMIFSIYLITPFFRIIVQHAGRIDLVYLLSLWFIGFSFLPFLLSSPLFPTYEPSMLLLPFQYSGYFIVGYLLRNQQYSPKSLILFGTLFLFGIVPHFLGERFSNTFLAPGTVVSSLGLFYVLLIISQWLTVRINPFIRSLLMRISNAAFGIYLSHGIVQDIVKANGVIVFFVSAVLIILIQFGASFLKKRVTYLLQKKTKKKLFFQ